MNDKVKGDDGWHGGKYGTVVMQGPSKWLKVGEASTVNQSYAHQDVVEGLAS